MSSLCHGCDDNRRLLGSYHAIDHLTKLLGRCNNIFEVAVKDRHRRSSHTDDAHHSSQSVDIEDMSSIVDNAKELGNVTMALMCAFRSLSHGSLTNASIITTTPHAIEWLLLTGNKYLLMHNTRNSKANMNAPSSHVVDDILLSLVHTLRYILSFDSKDLKTARCTVADNGKCRKCYCK